MDANTNSVVPLFTPYKLGRFDLSHRIVFPALTRNRAQKNMPQQPHATEYYAQRATSGGLLISEAAAASDISQGCPNLPGIWSEEQVEAWKPVVEGVHDKGGVFFCQIWHSARLSVPTISALYFSIGVGSWLVLDNIWGFNFLQAGPDEQVYEKPTPRRLKSDEVRGIVNDFRIAARNAIKAGFDGVEINASDGGYLIDEFMNDIQVNDRNSIEDRCQLALEIVEAVANEIGANRIGIKLSPFSDCDGKNKDHSNSEGLATYMANALSKLGVLYLHVVEPREATKGLLPIRKAFQGTLIASGGYNKFDGDNAIEENYADLISFGRMFLANPDLPKRFEVNAPLNKYNRSTFYTNDPVIGYTDYPSLEVAS